MRGQRDRRLLPAVLEPTVQFVGEQQVGQLGLAVADDAAVAALEL